MADLDDFFAKKDKKKSKGKKFATAEELAKKLEDTSKKSEVKPKSRLTNSNNDGDDTNTHEQINEDEWKEFEDDDIQKDYSNLKIGQLTISEEDKNQINMGNMDDGSDGQSDGEGNSENSDRRPSGPWNKAGGAEAPSQQHLQQKPTSNVYVSPAMRNQSAQVYGRAKNRVAPDLSNEEYFPSLGTASKQELLAKKKIDSHFEEVKHGGRVQKTSDLPSNAPVTTGNRFNSFAD